MFADSADVYKLIVEFVDIFLCFMTISEVKYLNPVIVRLKIPENRTLIRMLIVQLNLNFQKYTVTG